MKQSSLQGEHSDKVQVSMKSKMRLIHQNKKLLTEVYKLQSIINAVLQKSVTNEFQIVVENQEAKKKYKEEVDQQLKHIIRLKKQIKKIKASLGQHKYQEVKDEENQVTFLRREYQKLMKQRDTIQKKKRQKQEALEFHKPINNQTAQTNEHYKKLRIQNGQLKLKVHQLEREVAKYHKYKQLAKNAVPKLYDNPDYEFMKIDNEIKQMRKQMKRIQDKWKTKVQSLNHQYFSFKAIFVQKEAQLQNLQRQAKNLENKMNNKRDEISVANDRERVTNVPISPQKRKEMQDLLKQQRKKLKRLELKSNITKSKMDKQKKESFKLSEIQNKVLPTVIEVPAQTEKHKQQIKVQTQAKLQKQQNNKEPPKQNKMVQSVGVGTSFYYADD